MKIYYFKAKNLVFYSVFILCAVALIRLGASGVVSVYNSEAERKLPIYSVDRGGEKICSLTFDAAWGDEDTDELIGILSENDVKATFFVVGSWVEKYPNSVKKFFDSGHEIMNHSNTHPHINQLSNAKIEEEITKCDDKIEAVTGIRPTLFRGPYGEYNNNVISAAEKLNHMVIQWNVDSLDWRELSAEEIYERVIKRTESGSIILFHNGAKNTPEALKKILPRLIADGYKFVPVSELVYSENFVVDHSGTQKKVSE